MVAEYPRTRRDTPIQQDFSKPVEGIVMNGELLSWDRVEKETGWTKVESNGDEYADQGWTEEYYGDYWDESQYAAYWNEVQYEQPQYVAPVRKKRTPCHDFATRSFCPTGERCRWPHPGGVLWYGGWLKPDSKDAPTDAAPANKVPPAVEAE
jgi:hypothetical protein